MWFIFIALAATSGSAQAQSDVATPQVPTIQVMGIGKIAVPPTRALIDFWVAGEGHTPDDATKALADKQKAVTHGLAAFLGGHTILSGGNVVVIETYSPACKGPNSYGAQPQLSEGVCVPTGYIATLQGSVRTDAIAKAGTAVGLAARLGARDARLQQFILEDPTEPQRRATTAALADARERATALAAGSGARLGPVVSIRDQNSGMQNFIGMNARAEAPPPPPPPMVQAPAPIDIDVMPRPIDVQAQVFVTYAIVP